MSAERLPIVQIRTDGGTQVRERLNTEAVADYAERMRAGHAFPGVVVFHDGLYHWLADGFHRVAAAKETGATDIGADVRRGSVRDAILFAVGANAAHGLRRSKADQRRAVDLLLADPEWSLCPHDEIAKMAAVSTALVASVRRARDAAKPPEVRTVRDSKGVAVEWMFAGVTNRHPLGDVTEAQADRAAAMAAQALQSAQADGRGILHADERMELAWDRWRKGTEPQPATAVTPRVAESTPPEGPKGTQRDDVLTMLAEMSKDLPKLGRRYNDADLARFGQWATLVRKWVVSHG